MREWKHSELASVTLRIQDYIASFCGKLGKKRNQVAQKIGGSGEEKDSNKIPFLKTPMGDSCSP